MGETHAAAAALSDELLQRQLWSAKHIEQWCNKLKGVVRSAHSNVTEGRYGEAAANFEEARILCQRVAKVEGIVSYASEVRGKLEDCTEGELEQLRKQVNQRIHAFVTDLIQACPAEEVDMELSHMLDQSSLL